MERSATNDRQATNDGAASAFIRERFEWLDQVLADKELRPSSFSLAYIVARYVNRTTLDAWPSQKRLAMDACVSIRAVQIGIRELRQRGHLLVTSGTRSKRSNRYKLLLKRNPQPSVPPVQNMVNVPGALKPNSAPANPFSIDAKARNDRTAEQSCALSRTAVRAEQVQESLEQLTTTILVPHSESTLSLASKIGLEEERLRKTEWILGVSRTRKSQARWTAELRRYSQLGFDFERHLVPAMCDAASREGGPPKITSLMYFLAPAEKNRELQQHVGNSWWDIILESCEDGFRRRREMQATLKGVGNTHDGQLR